MAATPLVMDVDTGVDDAVALLFAVSSPEVELIGATCVMGNVSVRQATENTLAVLELAGLGDVEVASGASRPLVRDHEPFPEVHGERGLGRAVLAPPRASASARSAAQLLVETVRARPGEVLLVATGPLTNIALAVAEEPRLPQLLKGFAIMGGAFAKAGNVSPAAEANIWVDPEAAQAVFRAFAGVPEPQLPICAGLDVTERVRMTTADVEEVCAPAPDTPLARFVRETVPFYIEFYERHGDGSGAAMHDPLALAIALDLSLAELATTRVEVECEGRWTRGMTVTDLADVRHSPWAMDWQPAENARVALSVDAERASARLLERMRGLVEARA